MAAALEVGALLPRSVELVLARLVSGASHALHGHIDWAVRQIIPATADAEFIDAHARRVGLVPTRKPATFAQGNVTFTGTDNVDIPAGTRVRRADAAEYSTDADVTIASGTAVVAVTSVEAGLSQNTTTGTLLGLVSPISGVSNTVTAGDLTGGTDRESDADLIERIYQRAQNVPMGGTAGDYVAWALQVPGVTRAWCLPLYLGEPARVGLAFAVDNDPDGPIPDAGQVAAVQAYVDALRPVTANLTVFAPTELALDPFITLTPDTSTVRAAVQLALEDLVRREGGPGSTLLVSHVREAISLAAGETDHTLGWPIGSIVVGDDKLLTLGTITWT